MNGREQKNYEFLNELVTKTAQHFNAGDTTHTSEAMRVFNGKLVVDDAREWYVSIIHQKYHD